MSSSSESSNRPTWRTGESAGLATPDKHDTENPASGIHHPDTSEEQAKQDQLPLNQQAATPEGAPVGEEAGRPPENRQEPHPVRVGAHEHRH